ncbi:MAG: 16S rRNA (cytosine(967)-C(5))-methyltransferase RsmB [Deltaproteobacteria bacterium]|nr:16S rRNA (cytosine(967)-C(5))-methyltransferase RsmB [Deltaproteobacteria bacterium]
MRGDDRRRGAPTRTRLLALRVLERVQRAGAFADIALSHALSRSGLSAPDRAFATELVYGTLRWRGRIDYLLEQCLDRDLEKLEPLVATALRLGAYQLVFTNSVPATAAVDESVRCVRAAGVERATGLVNAVLRRLAAEHTRIPLPELDSDPVDHLVHALSLPRWIAKRWLSIYGPTEASALARASNEPPPLTVRVNRQRRSVAELLAEVSERFPDAVRCQLALDGIQLGRRGNPGLDPGFLSGHFTVQDEASQLVVGLLDPAPGERVLDVCAAPGGKATAIAERVGGEGRVLALDRHARRLGLVSRSARRLGLDNIDCAERDATRPLIDLGGTPFDRVLVDAPCSGLGTLRRHPDARWRVQPGDPDKLAAIQAALLRSAAEVVKPGGTLVYSTCTVLPEENEWIVEAFLKSTPNFALSATSELPTEVRSVVGSDRALRCLPHRHDADGFFAARLERLT